MMWKASVMVKFEAVCRNFPGKFEKNRESVIWARGFLNRYSNRGSSDCKSDTLSLEPSPSVRCGCRREQRMISTYAGSNTLIVIKEASRGIREGGTGPRILHISSTWTSTFRFTLRPSYPPQNAQRNQMYPFWGWWWKEISWPYRESINNLSTRNY